MNGLYQVRAPLSVPRGSNTANTLTLQSAGRWWWLYADSLQRAWTRWQSWWIDDIYFDGEWRSINSILVAILPPFANVWLVFTLLRYRWSAWRLLQLLSFALFNHFDWDLFLRLIFVSFNLSSICSAVPLSLKPTHSYPSPLNCNELCSPIEWPLFSLWWWWWWQWWRW